MAAVADFPTIDISDIAEPETEPSPEVLLAVGRQVVTAFQQAGFVYLRGHGVSASLQTDTFAASRAFFALDETAKRRFARFEKTGYNGYTPVGGENTGKLTEADLLDLKECYDFHIIGEDYPDAVLPGFCQQLELLALACCRLSGRLLAALQEALLNQQPAADQQPTAGAQQQQQQQNGHQGTGPEHNPITTDPGDQQLLSSDHQLTSSEDQLTDLQLSGRGLLTAGHCRMLRSGGCAALRVLNYPPVPEGAVEAGAVRCAPHTDYGTVTLLFQDQLGGLEVETAGGIWQPAPPLEDAILVNVGDLMETWSSGRLRATKHRVVIPHEELLRMRARQSIAMFVEPDDDVMVRPLDGDERFAAVNAGEALRTKFAKTYPAFGAWQQRSRLGEEVVAE